MAATRECDFTIGTILGKGFAQALVPTVNSTRAFGTRAIDRRHLCLSKTLSQDCPHGEIRHSLIEEHKIAMVKNALQMTLSWSHDQLLWREAFLKTISLW